MDSELRDPPSRSGDCADASAPHRQDWRRALPALGVVVGASAVVATLYTGLFRCPVGRFLHVPCPACGSTRAIYALARGDLHEALRMNPLAPVAALLLALVGVRAVRAAWLTGSIRSAAEGPIGERLSRGLVWVVALQILVWLLRMFGLLGGPTPSLTTARDRGFSSQARRGR